MPIPITIPEKSHVLVKINQEIDFETPLYEQIQEKEIKIPLSTKLKINPSKIFKYLRKFVGEKINKGEVLAVKKSIFTDLKYISEYDGIIKEINHETGEIILLTDGNNSNIKSFFKGTAIEIETMYIAINLQSEKIHYPLKKTARDFGGEILNLKKIDNHQLTEEIVLKKIIICETLDTYTVIKLEALGALGFVTLKSLNYDTSLPQTIIKNIDDLNKIFDYNFRYCLISKKENEIYLYN